MRDPVYWLRYFTDTSLGEQGVVLTEAWKSLSALKNVMGFIVYLDNVVFTTYFFFFLLKVPVNSTGRFELFLGCQV